MEFRVLGPLELWVDGRQYQVGSGKERRLLAVLLCAGGASVPVDTLLRRVWEERPPASGSATLQSCVSRLRNQLRAAVGDRAHVEFTARSYALRVADPHSIDLHRFQSLSRQARAAAATDQHRAVTLLRSAEVLWRAEPLMEFSGSWASATRRRLTEDLRRAREQRIALELDLGRHADLVGELYELIAHDPGAEPYARQLMLALYRCGRYGAALGVYRDIRRHVAEELGCDLSPELAELHHRMLRRDPKLRGPVSAPPPAAAAPPDSLPRDIGDFTGRGHELGKLLAHPEPGATAMSLTVIHGMGGVGKTALATHAAHLLAEHFPGGRFYVSLRAHHEQPPVDPKDALAALLLSVGVPTEDLPASLDRRAALWRERMAHSRALLLLDDARSTEQVVPLLPGARTCRVFVTSRHRLADLQGAWSVCLEVPDTVEATAMFTRIAGADRVSDTAAVRQVVALCGRHPLAIRLAANRFRHRESWGVHDLADQLTQSARPLAEIDAPPGIASAFDLSYAGLGTAHQRLFRHLALHPGPDLTLPAACALAAGEPAQVRAGLDALLDAHLLEEPVMGRYRLHDVVRDFALRTGEREDAEEVRHRAARSVVEHYLSVADHADRLAHPQRRRLPLSTPLPEPRNAPQDADAAAAWLDLNRGNLLAAARLATELHPTAAMAFPHVLDRAVHIWGMWEAAAELNAVALRLARGHGDPVTVPRLLVERAALLRPQGAHEEAMACARESLAGGEAAKDHRLQGEALDQMGIVDLVSGRLAEALRRFRAALPLHRSVGNRDGEAETLNHQGIVLAHLGRLQDAAGQFHTMLALHEDAENAHGQIKALNNIGEVYSLQLRHAEAREYYERSLTLVRRVGGRQELAILYNNLGNLCREAKEFPQALTYFQLALETYRDIHDASGQTDSLVNLGITYQADGQYGEARVYLELADQIARLIGDRHQQQRVLTATGVAQRAHGEYATALRTYRAALDLARELDRPYEEAHTLGAIAEIVHTEHGASAAAPHWREALALYERLGLARQAEDLRSRAAAAGGPVA
ncbi:AfsR/SARP family transcriptional regulator [Streptomyces zagrosensis]|uniref:DNA-binding SARP family transcriptional activator/tetratricopeptide (TPR) repeat protein n=1 Tax=Streptomyces zagrosensis TaxID=1042984 RepID=A0A7W9QD74_9ACTN|nr:BTAD domain-containing putative transcriptional regulator [Streptomyces zagrosensis]MBB5937047.1 DNA-binding SARP family transcriptional activator/tetratricopeptide (TPR) repeat protein [Streptomyces zagrosensis]